MFHRTLFSSLVALSLFGLAAPACDGGDDACDSGGDDDGDADDGNGGDGNGDDGNGGDGNGDDGNGGDGNGGDGNGGDGNADDGNADDGGGGGGGGGVGDQCQTNADCDSDSCIFAGDVDFGICTIVCEDFSDCPSFWSCEEIGNATGTYCVPD